MSPIFITESGTLIDVKLQQLANAEIPIFVTKYGMLIYVKLEYPENVSCAIFVIVDDKFIDNKISFEIPVYSNPTFSTDCGIDICVKFIQSKNA